MKMWPLVFLCVFVFADGAASAKRTPQQAQKEAAPAKDAAPPPSAEPDKPRPWWPEAATVGPAKVPLIGQATLDLPESHIFLPKKESQELMERLGNKPGENDVGMILPKDVETQKYFVTVDWDPAGYVKDDEADKLDAKEILEAIREGNEESNKYRKEHGFKQVTVVGWDEAPRYEKSLHHIVWAIRGRGEEGGDVVNFNTRLLGRNGYLSLNLICGPEQLPTLKPVMKELLGKVTYDAGKRYADFQPGRDKVAEYGLAALVLGGGAATAAKVAKVGLLAKFGKVFVGLLLAFKKAFVLVLIAIGAFIKSLFGRGKKQEDPPAPPAAPSGDGT